MRTLTPADRLFPAQALAVCRKLHASPRLVSHLRMVHEASVLLVDGISESWPDFSFDKDLVLLGAAIHDLGKTAHPNEMDGPGDRHEEDGPALLEGIGMPAKVARFARDHARACKDSPTEVLLVALSDVCWKGRRDKKIEDLLCERISAETHEELWAVFMGLDDILSEITAEGDRRLLSIID